MASKEILKKTTEYCYYLDDSSGAPERYQNIFFAAEIVYSSFQNARQKG